MADLPVKKLKINGTEFSPVINVDSTPTEGSTNPITSDGMYSQLENIPKLDTENTFTGDNEFTGKFRAYSKTGSMTLISTEAGASVGGKTVSISTTDSGSGEISIEPGEISISVMQPNGVINLAAPSVNLELHTSVYSTKKPTLNLTGSDNNITILASDDATNLTIDVPDVTLDGNLSITSDNTIQLDYSNNEYGQIRKNSYALILKNQFAEGNYYNQLFIGSGELSFSGGWNSYTYNLNIPRQTGTVALVSDITTAISKCASDLTKLDESGNYTIKDVVTTLNKLLTLLGAQSHTTTTSES